MIKQRVTEALNHIEDVHETHGVTGAIEMHEAGYRIILRKDSLYHANIVAWEHVEHAYINPLCATIDRMAEELCKRLVPPSNQTASYIRG
jgi:hypothetical protein